MGHFVSSCVRVGWTEPLSADVAAWATQLWATNDSSESRAATYLYWDWHVKVVYSGYRVPRSKHGTSDRIVGARKQLMLHDGAGHLLFMRTYRGDTHLIAGMVDGTVYYEGLAESRRLSHQIFDREGLSVAHFKDLLGGEEQRQFITCLKSNQYEGLDYRCRDCKTKRDG
jgi:prepilin-type processing-associated H-X9-DG protein